jgi:type IV pilus assembly protein PilV
MSFTTIINHKKRQNCNGFTLIEVLIAMAIFAIGILGVAKMQISAINSNASTRKYTEASTWGASQIESIMEIPYDDPALADGTTDNVTHEIYTVNWTITDADPIPNVKKISLIVTWDNNKSFHADYYKAKNF